MARPMALARVTSQQRGCAPRWPAGDVRSWEEVSRPVPPDDPRQPSSPEPVAAPESCPPRRPPHKPRLRDLERRIERRQSGRLGVVEDLVQRAADPSHAPACATRVVATPLLGDVDQPARVRDEIRRPQDRAGGEQFRNPVVRQLIVGGPGDDSAAQPRDGVVIEDAAERAGREHVDRRFERPRRRQPACAEPAGKLTLARIDVGDGQGRPGSRAQRRDPAADVTEPDDSDLPARERRRAEHALAARLDRDLDPERRQGAGIAGAASLPREAGDVARRTRDQTHVTARGPDVLGGDVPAAERVHGVGEVEQRRAADPTRGNDSGGDHEHTLAATEREIGDGRLVGHRPRQPERVTQGCTRVLITPHPASTERRTACRRVDRDDRVEARAPSTPDEHLFVVERFEVAGDCSAAGRDAVRAGAGGGVALAGSRRGRGHGRAAAAGAA